MIKKYKWFSSNPFRFSVDIKQFSTADNVPADELIGLQLPSFSVLYYSDHMLFSKISISDGPLDTMSEREPDNVLIYKFGTEDYKSVVS